MVCCGGIDGTRGDNIKRSWNEVRITKDYKFCTNYCNELFSLLIFLIKILQLIIEFTYREIFIDPATNKTWKEGQFYKRENFADTLERIGKNGLQEFYTGDTAKSLIDDLNQQNSILTLKDLYGYR